MKAYNNKPKTLIKQWEAALKARGLKSEVIKVAKILGLDYKVIK